MKKRFLTKRRHGIWYVVTNQDDGRRTFKSTGTRNRAEAERILQQESDADPRPVPFLIDFMKEYLDYASATYAASTVRLYRDAFLALHDEVGDVPIDTLTVRDMDRFKTRRVRHVKPITVNKELATIKAALNVAMRWGYLEKNPMIGVKKHRVPEKVPVYFSRDELEDLIARTADRWLRDIIIVAVNTGMRQGELLSLTWPNVDLNRRVVKVVNSETFRTKTGRHRVVPLNARAGLVLAERKELGEMYVFTQNGREIKQDWLTHKFKKHIRRLGLRDELHFHSLRHTFASWLVQDGVSLFQVGRLLGHRDMKSTEVYAHLQPETMHDVVARL